MKDQLIRYVDLLFAGAPHANDIKQEILQNTLDRYDDLIEQGKTPQAAYQLAISGIGDINEILGAPQASSDAPGITGTPPAKATAPWKKALRAVAVFLYIISITPLIVLAELGMEIIGLCGTIAIVAVATALITIAGGKSDAKNDSAKERQPDSPRQELRNAVKSIIFTVGLCGYLALSFATDEWWITWLIFPMIAAAQGLARACMDLKEAHKDES